MKNIHEYEVELNEASLHTKRIMGNRDRYN